MKTVTVYAERGLPGGEVQTYRFGARAVRGVPREPLRLNQPCAVAGLAIAHNSEVRAVLVRFGADWVPLVEGQPLVVPPGFRFDAGVIEVDALPDHPHDGTLILQIAETAAEAAMLSRHISPVTRLSLRRFGKHVFDERHREIHIAAPIAPTGVRQYLAISAAGTYSATQNIICGVLGGVRGPGGEWRWFHLGNFDAAGLAAEPRVFALASEDARHAAWEAWKILNMNWMPEDEDDLGISALITCGWDTGNFSAPLP